MRTSRPLLFGLALILACAAFTAFPALAQRGDDADRTSKNGIATGTVDGVEVTVEYGRPSVKGRTIWGGLVPWGEVWRAGADEATTVAFASDVRIEGETLPAGTYSFFAIPGEDEWTVIFNKTAQQWGAFRYDAGEDALRVTVEPREADMVETLEYAIEGDELILRWEKLAVPVTVSAA